MSGRSLPTDYANAMAATELAPVFLAYLDWPDVPVYLWNGYTDLNWNGQVWKGVGHLGSISEIKESADLTANGMQLTLSGVPSGNITEALRNDTMGRSGQVYFGVINKDGFTINPYLVFDGFIDVPTINDDGKTATISVNLEKELYDDRSNARRYTDQDQQIDYPGDTGFQYVAALATQQFTWGRAPALPPPSSSFPGDPLLEPQMP